MDIDMMTGRVGTLANGVWEGYRGEDATMSNLTGAFTGVRRGM